MGVARDIHQGDLQRFKGKETFPSPTGLLTASPIPADDLMINKPRGGAIRTATSTRFRFFTLLQLTDKLPTLFSRSQNSLPFHHHGGIVSSPP